MGEIYDLKEKIMNELKKYASKPELSAGSLETIDKLAHAAKNLCKIIEDEEESYSGARGGGRGRGSNAQRDSMGRYSSEGGYSNAGGGNYSNEGGYSNAGRGYSRARYSSEGNYSMHSADMVEELRDIMEEAQDPRMRQKIDRLITKMERS